MLVKRLEGWANQNGVIDKLQGANQRSCSSLHSGLLLRDVISDNIERQSIVWVCLLAICKAFDSVWIHGMSYTLYQTGIKGKLWRIMKDRYSGYISYVRIGGNTSDWLEVKQGVHQRAPFSMLLFEIFINPMLEELKASGFGAYIADIPGTCPSFADDGALVTLTQYALQKQTDVTVRFSQKLRFQFSSPKCLVMVFGKCDNNLSIEMNDVTWKRVVCSKHLGTILSSKPKDDVVAYKDCLSVARRTTYGTPGNPTSAVMEYKQQALPRMLCGTEIS